MTLELAPQVREMLSDEQIAAVQVQVDSGEAPCLRCGERIDPAAEQAASVLLIVDPAERRAAVRVSHAGCGPSVVAEAELPGPTDARLAERWVSFVLPGVPLVALQADAGVWTGEHQPALMTMLEALGFDSAREAFDSDLFATGVGAPPTADGLELIRDGADLVIGLRDGDALEVLPDILGGPWGELLDERGGALVAIGPTLGLPKPGEEGIGFDQLLVVLVERAVAAFVRLR